MQGHDWKKTARGQKSPHDTQWTCTICGAVTYCKVRPSRLLLLPYRVEGVDTKQFFDCDTRMVANVMES